MSAEESRAERIRNSREAVRAHMECGMPQRRAQWAEELKYRRLMQEAPPKPAPEEPVPANLVIAKSILDASPNHVDWESKTSRKARAAEEGGIESFWFGEK